MIEPSRIQAPAKINLFLHVTGKRSDGYHTLQSLVSFSNSDSTDTNDIIEIEPAEDFKFSVTGPFAETLKESGAEQENNLVVKAANVLADVTGNPLNIHIRLIKNLPIMAGLGGGSSDAAATIRGLLKAWNLERNTFHLLPHMTRLGADVPMCFSAEACLVQGIGEDLLPAPLMPLIPVVLVNPLQSCSTEKVFAHYMNNPYQEPIVLPSGFSSVFELASFLERQTNDLYGSALRVLPQIEEVMKAITDGNKCIFSQMSGSGATCFGIFETMKEAQKAAKAITKEHPEWWAKATQMG